MCLPLCGYRVYTKGIAMEREDACKNYDRS